MTGLNLRRCQVVQDLNWPRQSTSLITVLVQSTYSGLRVFREGIGWIPVEPVPGALVVNLGALMHILSTFEGIDPLM